MTEFNIISLENKHILNPIRLGSSRKAIYPSEASVKFLDNGFERYEGKCLREAWYRIMGYKKTEPASIYLNMVASVGKWDEVGTIERWKEMGIWVDNNVKFYNEEYVLSGELDCILRDPETKRLIGTENKSYYGYNAEKELLGGKRPPFPGRPKFPHFLQASIYNWEFKDVLDEYRIYYLDRGNGTRCEFRIGTELIEDKNVIWYQQIPSDNWNYFIPDRIYMPFTIEDIYSNIKLLGEYARKKELPPNDLSKPWEPEKIEYFRAKGELAKGKYDAWKKDPDNNPVKSYHCNYCKYRSQCAKDEMEKAI